MSERLALEKLHWSERVSASPGFHPDGRVNLRDWHGWVNGPRDSLWEDVVFEVKMEFPPEFPAVAPICRLSEGHISPHVDPAGRVHSDVLTGSEWDATYTIEDVLQHVRELLAGDMSQPAPVGPQVPAVDKDEMVDQFLATVDLATVEMGPAATSTIEKDQHQELIDDLILSRDHLKKVFLGDSPPEISANHWLLLSEILVDLEHAREMQLGVIRETGMHKTLRRVVICGNLPDDAPYDLRNRMRKLLAKWKAQRASLPKSLEI